MGSSEDYERKTLIEIGCGTGLLSILACQLGAHVIATDYLEEVLDLARVNSVGWWDVGKCRAQRDSREPNSVPEARPAG